MKAAVRRDPQSVLRDEPDRRRRCLGVSTAWKNGSSTGPGAATPSGSYLALSDGAPTEQATAAHDQYAETGAVPYTLRTPDELRSFFDGLELVEPGFGPVPLWRPELGTTADVPLIGEPAAVPDAPWGGVARRP